MDCIHFTNGAVYEGRFRDDKIDGQGTMKIMKSTTVPRETPEQEGNDSAKLATENNQEESVADENKEKRMNQESSTNSSQVSKRSTRTDLPRDLVYTAAYPQAMGAR